MGKRDKALNLARDFERDGFRVPGLYERFWQLQGDAAAYFALADSLLRGQQEGGTLLKDALGYVGEDDFKALIATAVGILREEGAEGRETKQNESAAQTGESARSARVNESASKNARQRGRDEKARAGKTPKRSSLRKVLSSRRFCTSIWASFLNCSPTRARITRSIRGAGLVTRAHKSGVRGLRIRRRAKMSGKKFLAACCKPASRET
nr:hypothetical protein [uncultured Campylobacter sp.]